MGLIARRSQMFKHDHGRLPAGYQEVEWIESSGTQYIHTEFQPLPGDEFNIKFKRTQAANNQTIFSSGTGTHQFILITASGVTFAYFRCFSENSSTLERILDLQPVNCRIAGDGTLSTDYRSYSGQVIQEKGNTDTTLYLFIRANITTPFNGAIYSCKAIRNGIIVMELVPCYRKVDNVIGMFDLSSNKFYTNAGSGTFAKGADI